MTKKITLTFLLFILIIGSISYLVFWSIFSYKFKNEIRAMEEQMYFVPFNPENATSEDWDYLNNQNWITINTIDLSNFYFVYSTMDVIGEAPNLFLHSNIHVTSNDVDPEYQDDLKASFLELAIFFTTIKYITFTKEFADYIINYNDSITLGSAENHYYFNPYGLYKNQNVYYAEGSKEKQARVNPVEMLLELRNITYGLFMGPKIPEWILYDYMLYSNFDYNFNDFYNFDPYYFDIYGLANAPAQLKISIDWNENIFNNPDDLSSPYYVGYLLQRNNIFGKGIPENSNGIKEVPKAQQNVEVITHEMSHILGYKHANKDKWYDSVYWIGETYQVIYEETFYSSIYNQKMTLPQWFYNQISFESKESWETYNLYSELWNYDTDLHGSTVKIVNYYNIGIKKIGSKYSNFKNLEYLDDLNIEI